MKKELYHILEKPYKSKYGLFVQKIILANIFLNLLSLVAIELFSSITSIVNSFELINNITVSLFIVELLLRYIAIGEDKKYAGFMGRVKFTFTFYTLVDIIAIVPFLFTFTSLNTSYFRAIRLIRFLRILKLIRMQKIFKNLFSLNHFVSSGIWLQSLVLFSVSATIIYLFSYAYGSISKSAMVFLDPPQIAELTQGFQIFIGIFELILGLVVGGALISIITSAFITIIESIEKGYLPYKGSDHIVIINANQKLEFILQEIDRYYIYKGEEQDVVILLPPSSIETFKENLKQYASLEIFVVAGDLLNWNSYERVSINRAKKVLSLLDKRKKTKNQSRKTLQFLLSNELFKNEDLEFVIETDYVMHSKNIYSYIFDNTKHNYIIVDNSYLIGKILNRSVVNYDYFQILSELLTFNGFEFYVLDYDIVFNRKLTFEMASLQITDAILVGIVRDGHLSLNPKNSTELLVDDKLILIMENMFSYSLNKVENKNETNITIEQPSLKEERNILIVGNYTDIKVENITHFITQKSIENLQYFVKDDNNYMNKEIWDRFQKSDYDVIILNIEDEDEYTLTLYLRSLYKNDPYFIAKIVNIIHNPINAMLLNDNKQKNSLILSQKIIGEFMSQSLFNNYIPAIFDEITQSRGNEFYILDKQKYQELFTLEYQILKAVFIKNNMIYIGGFVDDKFVFDAKMIAELEKIVVLSEGV